MTRRVAVALGVGATALLAPAPAFAHGLVGKQDLPIPKVVFAWAACAVLVASFAGLAALWPTARLQQLHERVVFRIPFASVLVGDVFRAINPWLAIARAASWTWRRLGRPAPEPLPYPERLGRW